MRLTANRLRKIIAEEINRVIKEAAAGGSVCDPMSVSVEADGRSFTFEVDGQPLSCVLKPGATVSSVVDSMHACAEDEGMTLDPASCEETAMAALDALDMGDPDKLLDTRETDFIRKHGRGPY